jgi:broad specificity phosphatase PhoE
MEIVLARHGRPDFAQTRWIAPCQMGGMIERYNQVDVASDGVPAQLRARVAKSALILSSTLPRSMRSAERMAAERSVLAESVFCEAGLPFAKWRAPRLPYLLWAMIFRLGWFYGFRAHAESLAEAKSRAQAAADRLVSLARQHGSVLLVGHGIMNGLIAKQLLARGAVGPRRTNNGYWQFTAYTTEGVSPRSTCK